MRAEVIGALANVLFALRAGAAAGADADARFCALAPGVAPLALSVARAHDGTAGCDGCLARIEAMSTLVVLSCVCLRDEYLTSLLDSDVALAALALLDRYPGDPHILHLAAIVIFAACSAERWRARLLRGGALAVLARVRSAQRGRDMKDVVGKLVKAVNEGLR